MFIKLNGNRGSLEVGIKRLRKLCIKEKVIMEARGRVAYETKSQRKKRKAQESIILTIKNRKRSFFAGY